MMFGMKAHESPTVWDSKTWPIKDENAREVLRLWGEIAAGQYDKNRPVAIYDFYKYIATILPIAGDFDAVAIDVRGIHVYAIVSTKIGG